MDNILKGIAMFIKSIIKCPLTRYHVAGIFILLAVQRNSEIDPAEAVREVYYKLRFAPTPTKLLTWPIRMALCFLLALPHLHDFPLDLIVCGQHIFPFVFVTEIMSCLLLGLHVTNYCNINGSKCFYIEDVLEDFDDFRSTFIDSLMQLFVTTHIIYTMWLIKSIMHVIQFVFRKIYKWIVLHVVPKVIPASRIVVLLFVLNLQDAVIPIICVYIAFKIFLECWLLPLIDRPFSFPGDPEGTEEYYERRNPNNDNDDGNSSELSDEFEDILEPANAVVSA